MKINIVNKPLHAERGGYRSTTVVACPSCMQYAPPHGSGDRAESQTVKAKLGLRELVLDGAFAPASASPRSSSETARRRGRLCASRSRRLPTRAARARRRAAQAFVVRSFTRARDLSGAIRVARRVEDTAARLAAERLESGDDSTRSSRRWTPRRGPRGRDARVARPLRVELDDDYHDTLVEAGQEPDARPRDRGRRRPPVRRTWSRSARPRVAQDARARS